MGAVGALQTGTGLQQISDLRAAAIIARAQGMDEQAKEIDGMVSDILGKSSNAVDFLDDLVATGSQKATSALDRMGMKYTRDKETGKIIFTPEDIAQNKAPDTTKDSVYNPGGVDVAMLGSESDDNAAEAAARAASRARAKKNREAMAKAQKSTGGSDDISAIKEAYEEAGGEWATGGRAEGGLMSRKKTKKK
jgi:hypothetical protein